MLEMRECRAASAVDRDTRAARALNLAERGDRAKGREDSRECTSDDARSRGWRFKNTRRCGRRMSAESARVLTELTRMEREVRSDEQSAGRIKRSFRFEGLEGSLLARRATRTSGNSKERCDGERSDANVHDARSAVGGQLSVSLENRKPASRWRRRRGEGGLLPSAACDRPQAATILPSSAHHFGHDDSTAMRTIRGAPGGVVPNRRG